MRKGWSLRERGDGSFEMNYYVFDPATGKTKRKYVTLHADSKKDANAKAAQLYAQVAASDWAETSDITLEQWIPQWLEARRVAGRKPKTLRRYEQDSRLYLIPNLGKVPLKKLRAEHITDFYAKLLKGGRAGDTATGKKGEPLPPITVHGIHASLSSAISLAIDRKHLKSNPLDGVEPPAVPKKKEYKILTDKEAIALIEASRTTGRYSLYLAALMTGARQGELLGLRWQDIDFQNNIIYIRQKLDEAYTENGPRFGEPKSETSRRAVALAGPLRDALLDLWKTEQMERTRPDFDAQHDLVWHVPGGGPISARNLTRQFKGLLETAKCPDIRFHDLRHTSASLMHAAGVPLKTVQNILGHSSIQVTGDMYTHLSVEGQRFAADIVASILGSDKKSEKPTASKLVVKRVSTKRWQNSGKPMKKGLR